MAATWDVDGAIVPIDAKPATDVQGSLQLLVPWQYQGPKLGGRRTGPCYSADPRSIALWACGRRVIAGADGEFLSGPCAMATRDREFPRRRPVAILATLFATISKRLSAHRPTTAIGASNRPIKIMIL